ncbi:MAG: hypothetical protein MK185_01695 [Saccharospirillaceae bacterium]|nr:hypothetical protein A3759_17660 [Thalassolituus sp. HI0120]MCH2039334.1 hypothetical protein [Saccharospirillaceae bacterium]
MLYQLVADKKLGCVSPRKLPKVSLDSFESNNTAIFSFRPYPRKYKSRKIRKFDGCSRISIGKCRNIVLYNVINDSQFYANILWDVLHLVPLGGTVEIIEDCNLSYSLPEYYADSFENISQGERGVVYKKVDRLRVESSSGLNDWSFCIPVGPGDATVLNKIVERILDIDVPVKEVILCGRPGENFKYFDSVKIVGEDIPAPPVWITKKKNILVESASYNNICMLHDRVYLPLDFGEAMSRYGDNYPLLTFQSLFFDDKYNFCPRRYSDFNFIKGRLSNGVSGFFKSDQNLNGGAVFKPILKLVDSSGFAYAHPRRGHPGSSYATGSLYIVKKALWKYVSQDESLYWAEFEDVEYGIRAFKFGVPSVVNPYSLTQSINSRPLLSHYGGVIAEKTSGKLSYVFGAFEFFPIPRKPLFRLTKDEFVRKCYIYTNIYVKNKEAITDILEILSKKVVSNKERLLVIMGLLEATTLKLDRGSVHRFVLDLEKYLFLDEISPSAKYWMIESILEQGGDIDLNGLVEKVGLASQISQRSSKGIFLKSYSDYYVKKGPLSYLGSSISAMWLCYFTDLVYLRGGRKAMLRAISASTPYLDRAGEK